MKDLYFKVKKIEREDGVYTGIILPHFEKRSFNWADNELSTSMVDFLTLTGEMITFREGAKFQNTRITDKKVKEIVDKIINIAKEDYKLKVKMIELNKEGDALCKSSRKKGEEILAGISEVIKTQGFLTAREFIDKMDSIITSSYSIDYTISNNKLMKIKLEKEHDLGRWIRDGQYSFLYIEYDDNVCVSDNYQNNKQLKELKSKYFKKLTINKVCGYNITEDFYPQGGGDKRSAGLYQEFEVDLKKGIDLKKENLPTIAQIFREIFQNLK